MTTFAYAARAARPRARRDGAAQPATALNADTAYIPSSTLDLWKNAKRHYGR
jgi:hypothetical protein